MPKSDFGEPICVIDREFLGPARSEGVDRMDLSLNEEILFIPFGVTVALLQDIGFRCFLGFRCFTSSCFDVVS